MRPQSPHWTVTGWSHLMLGILDVTGALHLRGWPADLDLATTIGVTTHSTTDRYRRPRRDRTHDDPAIVQFTPLQFAAWYAGGYRTETAARMSGVHADSSAALTELVRATTENEPWLPDHF